MTINEYQQLALRTNPVKDNKSMQGILQGVMGLNGEAGEAIDIVKKYLFQGHNLDNHHQHYQAERINVLNWHTI